MFFDVEFDTVISIGEDCACTSYLRRFNLQDCSNPFDWLTKAPFESRIKLLLNDFEDFLEEEDLYKLDKSQYENVDKVCDYWADKRYDFYYYHDFKSGEPFEKEYKRVKSKYDRRIQRMFDNIIIADTVLFVWWSRNKHQDIELIEESYKNLTEKYPSKQLYFLIIEFAEEPEEIYLSENHICISRFDNKSYTHNPEWDKTMGNEANNMKLFSRIKRKQTNNWYIKRLIFVIIEGIIFLIPSRKLKNKLNKYISYKFYKAKL